MIRVQPNSGYQIWIVRLEDMNLAAQPPKAFPHVLRPRVGVRPPRLHQPKLGQLSQTTQSTSPCLPLACLFSISLQMSNAIQWAALNIETGLVAHREKVGWQRKMVEPDSAGETLVLLGIIILQADLKLHWLHKPTKEIKLGCVVLDYYLNDGNQMFSISMTAYFLGLVKEPCRTSFTASYNVSLETLL